MRLIFLFMALILCLGSHPVQATTIALDLKDILPVVNIRLQGVRDNTDAYDFKLSIPARWQVNQAVLTFAYSHSSALVKSKSRLTFLFRGRPLVQVALDPLTPQGQVAVPIPGRLLEPGYHGFSFNVAHNSGEVQCQDPDAPELWSWVELTDARISFDVELKPVPARISAVSDFLFDPRNPSPPAVNLVFPALGEDAPLRQASDTQASMQATALCAAGIALRYDYRGVAFKAEKRLKPGMDNLLIGPADFVRSILAGYHRVPGTAPETASETPPGIRPGIQPGIQAEIKPVIEIDGPSLQILALPTATKEDPTAATNEDDIKTDPDHVLLVITGRTAAEVLTAATAFSLISLPLPHTAATLVRDIRIPDIPDRTLKNGLTPGRAYPLAGLGFATHTFEGIHPIPKGFSFRLPSDTFLPPDRQALLSLNLAYGASMRKDSVLNVQLNDQFVAAVPFQDLAGGTYRNYKVELLLSSMRPGYNQLTFAPRLTPLVTDQCTLIQTGNLRLTLFDDSTFILPTTEEWIEMPNLRAFMADAFPFGRAVGMAQSLVLLPDGRRDSFLTAVNLIALASQKSGFPPLGLEWEAEAGLEPNALEPAALNRRWPDQDIIVVGTANAIPTIFRDAAPFDFAAPGRVVYPHLSAPKSYSPSADQGLLSRLKPPRGSKIVDVSLTKSQLVVTRFEPVLTKGIAALMQFQSPFDRQRTVMVLTAADGPDLLAAGAALWKTRVQAACHGDTALINLTDLESPVNAMKIGPSYYLGGISSQPFLAYYANTYPLYFIAGILTLCVVLALILNRFIRIRRARRIHSE